MNDTPKGITINGSDRVLEFLPIFQSKKFTPGDWSKRRKSRKGTLSLPVYNYNIKVDEFVQSL
jgi:hypothetical protein